MSLSKTYKQEYDAPFTLIGCDDKSPENEDITELLGNSLTKKFLSFTSGRGKFEYALKSETPITLTKGYITGANDTNVFPEREAVEITISNGTDTVSTPLPKGLAHGKVGGFAIPEITGTRFFITVMNKNFGTSNATLAKIQFGPLVFPEMGDTRFSETLSEVEIIDYTQPQPEPEPT